MRGYLPCPECPHPLVGTVWRINDSGNRFEVMSVEAQYANVQNLNKPHRPRRILVSALRTSNAKTGYTQIGGVS